MLLREHKRNEEYTTRSNTIGSAQVTSILTRDTGFPIPRGLTIVTVQLVGNVNSLQMQLYLVHLIINKHI